MRCCLINMVGGIVDLSTSFESLHQELSFESEIKFVGGSIKVLWMGENMD